MFMALEAYLFLLIVETVLDFGLHRFFILL